MECLPSIWKRCGSSFPVTSNGKPYMPDTMIHLDERGSGITKEGRVVQLDVPALTAVVRGMVDQDRV